MSFGKRVLICDDSPLMRKLVADTLIAENWVICGEAANGHEAVDKYRALRPDIVTLDVVMPHSDGLYALPRILAFDPDAKVVVVSALSQTTIVSDAIRAGAVDFIVKPFMPDQLQETVARAAGLDWAPASA